LYVNTAPEFNTSPASEKPARQLALTCHVWGAELPSRCDCVTVTLMTTVHERHSTGADEALARLIEGNARFVRGEARFPTVQKDVLAGLAKGQQPYATIIGCSDSRVPPELIFDAGFGELFIVRIAGNVISPEVMGTLQYAAVHLRTQLFVVLGHQACGAVQAALAAKFRGTRELSRIERLLENMLPGLQDLDPDLAPDALIDAAVEANVRWSMHQLRETPEGKARMAEGVVKLVGAVYELNPGQVRLLP
jgi:carbonic anhydrase